MNNKVLSVRKYAAGYVVKTEEVNMGCESVIMKNAYTLNGEYIGNPKIARRLCVKKGIRPELSSPSHRVCSIGFCEKEQKWYGWSHRAIAGFGIGSTCKKGDCHYIPTTFEEIKNEGYFGEPCHLLDIDTNLCKKDKGLECCIENCIFPLGKGEWTAKTLEDAKQMAKDFARGVD